MAVAVGVLMEQARPYMRIGAEHRALRKARGLTQEQLADRAGVSEPQISVVEQGKQRPTRDYIEKVAPVLEVGVVWLQRQAGYVVSDSDSDEIPIDADTLAIIRGAIIRDGRIDLEVVPAIETMIRLAMREREAPPEE